MIHSIKTLLKKMPPYRRSALKEKSEREETVVLTIVAKISYFADFGEAYDHANPVQAAPSMTVKEVVQGGGGGDGRGWVDGVMLSVVSQ